MTEIEPRRESRHDEERLRVLIAGGGVAALEAMIALRDLALERVAVELLTPAVDFTYRPLSVAEPFGTSQAYAFDLSSFTAENNEVLHLGSLARVDEDRQIAVTDRHAELRYDVLLIASGARPEEALPGALTFWGSKEDTERFRALLEGAAGGEIRSIAFALPGGISWPLPLYELALQTAAYLAEQGVRVDISLVTHEEAPLSLFGGAASDALDELLEARGITVHTGEYVSHAMEGELRLIPEGAVQADRVVSLPRLKGPQLAGVPHDPEGFIPADPHGLVDGMLDVYAAGDVTSFPVKQGGIAAQQADAAAESIAARAGADVTPKPFDPVLRGMLLTGSAPSFLRAEIGGGHGDTSTVAAEALWWPPSKIVGHYLAPFLAEHTGWALAPAPPSGPNVLPIEVDLSAVELRPDSPTR